jgi:phage N-6-adenine-methyltransferase
MPEHIADGRGKPQRQKWATPRWLIDTIEGWIGESIACDACAEPSTAKSEWWYGPGSSLGEDGLVGKWPSIGTTWINPPYGSAGPWVRRAIAHARHHPEARVFLLLPPRTDQQWWHDLAECGQARCCALRPRVEFDAPEGVRRHMPSFPVVLWEVTQRAFRTPETYQWRETRAKRQA